MQPILPNLTEMKRNILDTQGWFIHVTRGSLQPGILEGGINPAHSDLMCAITNQQIICYAPLAHLGDILVEIGGMTDEATLLVVVLKAEAFHETHALPDTTHAELAGAQDTAPDLEQSINERGRIAYTRPIPPEMFADHFVIKNLYNPFLAGPDED